MLNENFVYLGLLAGALGLSSYFLATIKGTVKPNRLSWFILGLAPIVAFAAELDKDVGLRSLMTLWVGLGPLLIFAASFVNKNAYWKLNRFDILCAGFAITAFVAWQLTSEGNVAIALSILTDGLAALPILVKAWRYPHTELSWPFAGAMVNSSIALLVLDRWTFADYAFPLYILIVTTALVAIIEGRKRVVAPVTAY